jgi:hypothetical protein
MSSSILITSSLTFAIGTREKRGEAAGTFRVNCISSVVVFVAVPRLIISGCFLSRAEAVVAIEKIIKREHHTMLEIVFMKLLSKRDMVCE